MERSGVGGGKVLEISANKETASEGFLKASYDGEKKWSRVSLDLRLSWHKIGASSFLAPGSESVYTTPPFQIGRHPTHERHIGLPGPVNRVFSILYNIIHTA